MKIRTGFVSNSSSSSFVAIVDRDIYEKIYDDLPESFSLIADMIFEKKKGFVYGQILSGNFSEYFIDNLEDKKEYFKLAEILKEAGEDISESEIRSIVTEEVYEFEYAFSKLLREEDRDSYLIDGLEF